MVQYGFYFDQGRCWRCGACSVACRDWYDIRTGPVKYLRILEWEKGSFPSPRMHVLPLMCYHCENPVCVDAANGAMYKEDKYGAVLIDPEKAKSVDLRKANEACPYGVISFDSDAVDAIASKCTMCIDRLEQNLNPICVESCPMRAFDFGPLEDLQKKYGTVRQLEDMPDPTISNPAVVFKPHEAAKKQIVPYDANKALQLMATRDAGPAGPLPALYSTPTDATDPAGLIRKTKPIFHATNVAEFLDSSRTDEA
jgi:anaerobic dimethyl sulfoxide reductase subunit B (iron-sulfur subunit)